MILRSTIYWVFVAVVASVRVRHGTSASKLSRWGLRPGTQKATTHGRFFRFHVPKAYKRMRRTALVFTFHGTGLGPACSLKNYGLIRMSEKYNFIAVGGLSIGNNWNIGNCRGGTPACSAKDVTFFRTMVYWFQTRTYVDKNAILVTGYSRGGFMAYRIACEASDLVAVAGVVAGGLVGYCSSQKRPVSVLHFHGTTDRNVPYSCGPRAIRRYRHNSATRCKGPIRKVFANSNATCEAFTNCRGGASVHFCKIKGMHHSWPGARKYCYRTGYNACCGCSQPDSSLDAFKYIWFYFKRNRRRMGRPPQTAPRRANGARLARRRGSSLQLIAREVNNTSLAGAAAILPEVPSKEESLGGDFDQKAPEEDDREIGEEPNACGVEGCALCNDPNSMTDLPCAAAESAATEHVGDCSGAFCAGADDVPLVQPSLMPRWWREAGRRAIGKGADSSGNLDDAR